MHKPALLLAVAALVACRGGQTPAPLKPEDVLGETGAAGFERAAAPRRFRFPEDHGAHPAFRTEWWYLTGHLWAGSREFGYQLSLFRFGLRAGADPQGDGWRSGQLYLGHFALTDVAGERFHAAERVSRGAAGLAGAARDALDVRVEDFALRLESGTLTARASDLGYAIDLRLTPLGAPVPHGDGGLHRKGAGPGNASHYYSMPRWSAAGSVRVPGAEFEAAGDGWLDREWSSGALAPEQSGWDWFALKLGDADSLMLYRLRDRVGAMHPFSGGVFLPAAGAPRTLAADDVVYRVLREWTSEATSARYPVAWRLEIPVLDLSLEVEPLLDAQELDLSFRYWEGAAELTGVRAGETLSGRAYVELTGYD